METALVTDKQAYKPFESVFDVMDKIARKNSSMALKNIAKPARDVPSDNKAILYFDRSIQGQQTFTNSVYSLEIQPELKTNSKQNL